MRLRSGRNTHSTPSNRSPFISNKQSPELYPLVHNNSQRRRSRHARRRRPLFYKLYNLSRLYLNGQTSKRPRSSLSDLPSPRLIPSIPESIIQVLYDLNLPFFDPISSDNAAELDAEVSTSLLSTRLGWSISSTDQIPIPAVLKERSGCLGSPLPVQLPLHAYARETGPSMNVLPTEYPERRLYGRIYHETERFDNASLIFAREWEPFRQKSTYNLFGVSSDSNMTTSERFFNPIDGSILEPSFVASHSPAELLSISVRSSTLRHQRSRSQWETIRSLQMNQPEWRVDTYSNIVERDERRHAGNIDCNQSSRDRDSWSQSSIPKLTAHGFPLPRAHQHDIDSSGVLEESSESIYLDTSTETKFDGQEMSVVPREVPARYQLGDIIANIMTCAQLPVSRNVVLEPPWPMRCSNRDVTLSLASLVPPQGLPWKRTQLPVLFTAQYCVKGNEKNAIAQMAHALHQTLLTLVLYYLDTRRALHEQLPAWMVVYGIVYHDEGFSIHAHFPVFHFSPADTGGWTTRTFGWAFYSVPVKTFNGFSPLSSSRRREIATLLRLQSHARYMLCQLQEWTGYECTLRLMCKDRSEP